MTTDIDQLSDFSAQIASIKRDMDELKNRQFIGGDNIQMKLTTTDDTWDVDETVPSTAGITWWQVVFMPDNGVTPYGQFSFDYLVTPDSGFEYFSYFPSPLYDDPVGLAWIVEYSNPNITDVNAKIKFGVKALDTGSLTWSMVRQTA